MKPQQDQRLTEVIAQTILRMKLRGVAPARIRSMQQMWDTLLNSEKQVTSE